MRRGGHVSRIPGTGSSDPVLAPPDYSEKKIARTAAKTLLERWGTPEDVSKAVNFLVEADYINADVIRVDGGQRYATRKNEAG